ncbi:MAG: hypothetical protein ACF8R7_17040 [Phycisphaerales bacterium JB039]
MMRLNRLLSCLLPALVCALAAPGPARADEFVDRVNAMFDDIRPSERSDRILLPALAGMEAPPAAIGEPLAARLLTVDSADYEAAESWCMAPSQRAVLEALERATVEDVAMAFGQRYGAEDFEDVRLGLYTELGDPPLLSAAEHLYLPAMDNLAILVNVEAARLLGAGDPGAAIDLLIDLALLGRQMSERAFYEEVFWGMRTIFDALVRIRDIAYQDFNSGAPALSGARCAELVERLDPNRGSMRYERIRLPVGDFIGAQQVVAATFTARGGPNSQFGPILASISKGDRPLRLFGEAARWNAAAASHADVFQTREALEDVFADFEARWQLDYFDPMLALTPDYRKLDPMEHAVILATIPDMGPLFVERQALRTELVGTRTALAVLGYTLDTRSLPITIASARPRYIPALEADPYNELGRSVGRGRELQYFVPSRDLPVDPQVGPQPYAIDVVIRDGENFQAPIGLDEFVIYSVGPDNEEGWARQVSEEMREQFVGDYLIWPPILSLHRQHLRDTGQFR